MIQNERQEFNKRIEVKGNKSKLWKPNRQKNQNVLPNIPFATQEEKMKISELDKIRGELYRQKGDAKFYKNKEEEDRLTSEINKVFMQREQIMSKIRERQRQQQNGYER